MSDRRRLDHDVVIVGAGPAGLSTALHLAREAPRLAERCVVLEAKRHPRHKPCAGGVTPGAAAYLAKFGLATADLGAMPVTCVRARLGDREVVARSGPGCFEVVDRGALDAALACRLDGDGPVVEQETRVLEVHVAQDHVTVETDRGSLRCAAVVGADGAGSVVRRSLWPHSDGRRVIGLQQHCESTGTSSCDAVFDFTPTADGMPGYTWDFPAPGGGRSVGLFCHAHPRAAASYLRAHLWERDAGAAAARPFEGSRVRAFDPSEAPAMPRVLLVGDAAGIDPLLGEGIGQALGYGEIAARALSRAFASGDLSFAGYRGAVLAHHVGRCLKRRRIRSRVMSIRGSHLVLGPLWPFVVQVGEASELASL